MRKSHVVLAGSAAVVAALAFAGPAAADPATVSVHLGSYAGATLLPILPPNVALTVPAPQDVVGQLPIVNSVLPTVNSVLPTQLVPQIPQIQLPQQITVQSLVPPVVQPFIPPVITNLFG